MTKLEIGCCGAYCGKCSELSKGLCKGCKLGYDTGERDINRAKCKIKLCCFRDRGFATCADCEEFEGCEIVNVWYGKGYSRRKCRESVLFIRREGYEKFLELSEKWVRHYGKLE